MHLFCEWINSQEIDFGEDTVDLMELAYQAGYDQRSQEVAEDLRLFKGIMDSIDTEH